MAITDQVRVNSGFDHHSTGEEVLTGEDLAGMRVVVTGGYSGIGLETTKALAAHGAAVVVPVRSPQKAEKSLSGVPGEVTAVPMDLADLGSVQRFAASIAGRWDRLDLLINNAGIMANPLTRVGPGWESQFGVNHLGHFALTKALWPLVTASAGTRVVSLSSTAHKISDIRWEDINYASSEYQKWQAYGQSKTANALFANALSRRLKDTGGLAFAVHPGGIFTPLQRHLPREEMVALGWLDEQGEPTAMAQKGFKSPEQGCATTLWAATSELLVGAAGVYCEDCDVAEPADPSSDLARYRGVNAYACDDEAAERLWQVSEEMVAGV